MVSLKKENNVTLSEEEANFVLDTIMMLGFAQPSLKDDGKFMSMAKVVTDKIMNKKSA